MSGFGTYLQVVKDKRISTTQAYIVVAIVWFVASLGTFIMGRLSPIYLMPSGLVVPGTFTLEFVSAES